MVIFSRVALSELKTLKAKIDKTKIIFWLKYWTCVDKILVQNRLKSQFDQLKSA
jgi:hypothetical protein